MEPYFPIPAAQARPALKEHVSCDVLVIGGGICGILTAHLLARSGLDVVLVEANRLMRGQTRGTTAKITVQHGLFASRLIKGVGLDRARGYVQANMQAMRELTTLIKAVGVDCGLETMPAYLYTQNSPQPLYEEALACQRLGLPVRVTRHLPAPILPTAALRLDDQAQMNPFPLLHALAARLHVYEHTRVLGLDGTRAVTPEGSVSARCVAVCTHYPAFTLPGAYFMRLYQQRSYTLALRDAQPVGGMLYGVGPGTVSLRNAGGSVFLGGESHRSGDTQAANACYARLSREASRLFPGAKEAARWSAQDCMTADGIPYVGRYGSLTPNVYVATGFGKWGMTNAMAAAILLRDEIARGESPYADVFSPQRLPGVRAAKAICAQTGHACKGLGESILPPPVRTAESLAPGEGAIVRRGIGKAAAYRDEHGRLHQISPYCAHMKCLLHFNASERSWDCPCHGSRFTVDGELICGPAQRDAALKPCAHPQANESGSASRPKQDTEPSPV